MALNYENLLTIVLKLFSHTNNPIGLMPCVKFQQKRCMLCRFSFFKLMSPNLKVVKHVFVESQARIVVKVFSPMVVLSEKSMVLGIPIFLTYFKLFVLNEIFGEY